MDCEKYEPLLLDELYDELDEVTSAAVKRHVAGCARCSSILGGFRSTRRAVSIPLLDLPAGLEDRILSSVKEAQKVVPLQSRGSRLLSLAGSWAMRPQTAMAAVFLLMIGTSAFVIRARHGGPGSGEQSAAVSVTEKGEPAAPGADRGGPAGERDSLDNKAAAAAHGANVPTTLPPAATGFANGSAVAANDRDPAGPVDALTGGKGRPRTAEEGRALGSTLDTDPYAARDKDKPAEARKEESEEKKQVARKADGISNAGTPAGAPEPQQLAYGAAAQNAAPAARSGSDAAFSAGMAAYRARSFAEATRQFDVAAQSGDQNAALWGAKSVRDGSGCGAALARFEGVASRASGTYQGNEATLDAARCQITMGQYDAARTKLNHLATTSTHTTQAQQALAELEQVAARSKAGGAKGGNVRAAPAPAPPPAPARSDIGF